MSIDNRKPAFKDILHYQGDLFDLNLAVTKDDDTAYDMSVDTITMQIRRNRRRNVIFTLSTDDGIIVAGDDNNVLVFNKVIDIEAGSYAYDISDDTTGYTIQSGNFIVTEDITR